MTHEVSTATQFVPNSTSRGNSSEHFGQAMVQPTQEGSDDPSDDAVWILTSTFIIFTMQSGFGLLESGSVTPKNEVNIMMKNAIDVIVGGLTYWMFGYGFSFGDDKWSNPFSGWGSFFVDVDKEVFGQIYSKFFFQASFATTATTIVSGAMAERTKLEAYIVFSFVNTIVFCFPAHWVWADNGWLKALGMLDVAGDGPVHLVGGVTGLVATILLKPRHGRYDCTLPPAMGSPTNALLGMFMLWWGWLGFNCGSTFGISGQKWKLAARSAVATLCSSVGGGSVALVFRSAATTMAGSAAGGLIGLGSSYVVKKRKFDVGYLINGILGSLVAITGLCAFAQPWEGLLIGAIGAMLTLLAIEGLDKLHVDDPVGCVGVHAVGGAWGLLAVGLFARPDHLRHTIGFHQTDYGLLWGGGWYLIGVQTLGILVITAWTAVLSFTILKLIDFTVGLRMPLEHEILGADLVEHAVGDIEFDKVRRKVIGLRDNRGICQPIDNDETMPTFNVARKRRRLTLIHDSLERASAVEGRSVRNRHNEDAIMNELPQDDQVESNKYKAYSPADPDTTNALDFVSQKRPPPSGRHGSKWKYAVKSLLNEGHQEEGGKNRSNVQLIIKKSNRFGKGSIKKKTQPRFISRNSPAGNEHTPPASRQTWSQTYPESYDYDNQIFSCTDENTHDEGIKTFHISNGLVSHDVCRSVPTPCTNGFRNVPVRDLRGTIREESTEENSISVYL